MSSARHPSHQTSALAPAQHPPVIQMASGRFLLENPRKKPRKKVAAEELDLLVDVYTARPNVSSISLSEREMLAQRLGKTKQQITDFLRNRRAKECKDASKMGVDWESQSTSLAAQSRSLCARYPSGDDVLPLKASSFRAHKLSTGYKEGLNCWINFDENTLCCAVMSSNYVSLQHHLEIPLSSISAIRYTELPTKTGRSLLSVHFREAPSCSSTIYGYPFTRKAETDWNGAPVSLMGKLDLYLVDGKSTHLKLLNSPLADLLDKPCTVHVKDLAKSPLLMPLSLNADDLLLMPEAVLPKFDSVFEARAVEKQTFLNQLPVRSLPALPDFRSLCAANKVNVKIYTTPFERRTTVESH